MRIVVALGGNALSPPEASTIETRRAAAARAAEALVPLIRDHMVLLTHASGPRPYPFMDPESPVTLGGSPTESDCEPMAGYLLEEALRRAWPDLDVANVLACPVVDAADPAFGHPSRPVGPVYDPASVSHVAVERTFEVTHDIGGFRRIVPSPDPRGVLQARSILTLVDAGITVIAFGGGLPVVLDGDGRPTGVEAVVDADRIAGVLADLVDADVLMLLTDVDAVYRRFGTRGATPIRSLSTSEARALVDDGTAPPGSMGPKLEAAARAAQSGRFTVIAALDDASAALRRSAGTRVVDG